MLKPQDIAVAVKLHLCGQAWSYSRLADGLLLSRSEVHAAVKRLGGARLYSARRRAVRVDALHTFLVHGVQYAFAAQAGAVDLGLPSASSAAPLLDLFGDPADPLGRWVWPGPEGDVLGRSIKPLYKALPRACVADADLHEMMALIDAVRVEGARVRGVARAALRMRLVGP